MHRLASPEYLVSVKCSTQCSTNASCKSPTSRKRSMLHGQMNRPFELYIPTIIFTKNNRLDSAAQARYPPKRRPRTSSISATSYKAFQFFLYVNLFRSPKNSYGWALKPVQAKRRRRSHCSALGADSLSLEGSGSRQTLRSALAAGF